LYLLTTERLTNETIRANTAEQRLAETITTLRSVIDARNRALENHARTSEELRLWKVQLDNARAELGRGQEIIEKLERERNEAMDEAARDRGRVRKLLLERAVWNAREEGWNLGYNEGLRTARREYMDDVRIARRGPRRRLGDNDDEYEEDDRRIQDRAKGPTPPAQVQPPRRPPSR